jgi:CoA:oxalate CoA-transferase
MKTLALAERPLNGLLVIDFSQFLSGPLCGLKLADLGARVIKIERPGTGDLCRDLYLSDTEIDGDNSLFHAINRNKQSFAADLKNPADCARIRALLVHADVMIQNFRPGVIDKLGFGYDAVRELNPTIIYGAISGYGETGPWKDLPGQDLLAQARSGLLWLTGDHNDPPTPMGLAVADMMAGNNLTQGILAALVGRALRGGGARIDTSLLEAMIDLQFEVLTTHLNDGGRPPQRSAVSGAHAYLGAPYGVYATADGYLAIAMVPDLKTLAGLMQIKDLEPFFDDAGALLGQRDAIKGVLDTHIRTRTTNAWLKILQPADIWCSEVLDWPTLMRTPAFDELDLIQALSRTNAPLLNSLRNPLRLNGATLKSDRAAPSLGADTQAICEEFSLDQKVEGDTRRPA